MNWDDWIVRIVFIFLVTGTLIYILLKKFLFTKLGFDIQKPNRKFEISIAIVILIQHIIQFPIFNILYGKYHANLFGDLCTFCYLVVLIPLFIPRFEKIKKILMPWLLIGSIVTLSLGKSQFFVQLPEQISTYIESWFFLIKHVLLYILGIYYLLILQKYTKRDYLLVFVLPIVLCIWILLVSGTIWIITGQDKFAIYSTALFKPSIQSYDVDPNNLKEGYTEITKPGDSSRIWQDSSGLEHHERIKIVSVWNQTLYESYSTYIIVQIIAHTWKWHYLYVSLLFYLVSLIVAYVLVFLSNIKKYSKKIKNK